MIDLTAIFLSCLVLGAGAGILAGLLGVGGGIIIVPSLFWLFSSYGFQNDIMMHMAIGSSLMTVIFTAIASTRAHHQRGAVIWPVIRQMTPGIMIGALIGAAIANYLPTDTLRICFGFFEIIIAMQMLFGFKPKPSRSLPGNLGLGITGAGIGMVSTVLGIGGGSLTVPFLSWCNVAIRQAIATSAACGLPIAVAGAFGFLLTGWDHTSLPPISSGFIYWPAVIGIVITSSITAQSGAWLAHTLPVDTLKKVFAILLFIIGLRILL